MSFMQIAIGVFLLVGLVMPELAMAADPEDMLDDALEVWVELFTEGWIRNALGIVFIGAGIMAWANVMPMKWLATGTLGAFLILGAVPLATMIYDALN